MIKVYSKVIPTHKKIALWYGLNADAAQEKTQEQEAQYKRQAQARRNARLVNIITK